MSMTNSEDPSIRSNQDDPFAIFNESVKADQELKREAVTKALNLPRIPKPMHIDQSRNYHGDSPIVSIVKAALLAAGIGTAGWFALTMVRPDAEQATPAEDTNTRYELRFDD